MLGSRDVAKGERAASQLRAAGLDVAALELDVADLRSVRGAARKLDRCDALVNNAAIDYDTDQLASGADLDRIHRAIETNVFGAWRTTLALRSAPAGPATDMGGRRGEADLRRRRQRRVGRAAGRRRADGRLLPGWGSAALVRPV
jgi:NAD(P)-dependent dehydrogenase (short-subunit alcohol dehydrogenase family)